MPPRAFGLLRALLELRRPPLVAVHLVDHLGKQGIADDVWVPQIARDKDWLVVTTDNGRKSPRLPDILPAYGVPGVFLAGGLAERSGFEKIRALMAMLPAIEAGLSSGGTRFRIMPRGHGFTLTQWLWTPPK